MSAWLAGLPAPREFFPPTPKAFSLISIVFRVFPAISLLQWTPLRFTQLMGKTSSSSKSWFNLPGRYAWAMAEIVGPLNLIFILFTLPRLLKPEPASVSSLFTTGLPIQHEVMGLLYVIHYLNRAIITPLYLAPSMSPIHVQISILMAFFQFLNSSCLGCWLVYSMAGRSEMQTKLFTPASILGISMFIAGLAGNVIAENQLFSLRRAAARRKAKSEGKMITYDKVYVIPPAEGLFKSILFPHYSWEWLEWTGYWILGGAWGLGYGYGSSAALWFLISEIITMSPRAVEGLQWYEKKFGKRPLAGRKAVIPGIL